MTKKQQKTRKKKVICQNCKDLTDLPGIVNKKYYCQKCLLWRKLNLKQFPSKETIKCLKIAGKWKK